MCDFARLFLIFCAKTYFLHSCVRAISYFRSILHAIAKDHKRRPVVGMSVGVVVFAA